jgi:hypothetical protein
MWRQACKFIQTKKEAVALDAAASFFQNSIKVIGNSPIMHGDRIAIR